MQSSCVVEVEVESGQTAAIDSPRHGGVQFPASGAQQAQGTRAFTHGWNRRSTGERGRAARHGHGPDKMRASMVRTILVQLGTSGSSGPGRLGIKTFETFTRTGMQFSAAAAALENALNGPILPCAASQCKPPLSARQGSKDTIETGNDC